MSDDENWILEVMSPAEATLMNADGQTITDEIIPRHHDVSYYN